MRFYKQRTPDVDDYVVVKIKNISELGAYVELLEYDNIEGFIQLSELSKGNTSLKRYKVPTKTGNIETCVVLSVDANKNYLDLSKRRVDKKEMTKFQQKYTESKTVHSIIQHVSIKTGEEFEELMESIVWPLNDNEKYDNHSFNAFILAINQPDEVFENISFKNENIKKTLLQEICKRLTPPLMKFKTEIEITCYGEAGIDGIKSALNAGKSMELKENQIKVQLISSPDYIITTSSNDYQFGISLLDSCLEEIKYEIRRQHGHLVVKQNPKVYKDEEFMERVAEIKSKHQQIDDAGLKELMDEIGLENKQLL